MSKRLINEKELAEYSGFKIQTLQKWRLFGKGPVFLKIGASVRYDQADVDPGIGTVSSSGNSAPDPIEIEPSSDSMLIVRSSPSPSMSTLALPPIAPSAICSEICSPPHAAANSARTKISVKRLEEAPSIDSKTLPHYPSPIPWAGSPGCRACEPRVPKPSTAGRARGWSRRPGRRR